MADDLLAKPFKASALPVLCLSSSLDTHNFYAVVGSCAFKTQSHQAFSGLPVSCDCSQPQPQFLRLGFSAFPLTAQDFLRIELAFDVQRGEWIETAGADSSAAFPLLVAIARAHERQLMAYRSAWLQAMSSFENSTAQSMFVARQAASLERLRVSMVHCFAARNLLEIECIVTRQQRLYAELQQQHEAFRPLERSLFRLDVRALTAYFEVSSEGPAYFFEYNDGLPCKEQILLEPSATGYVVTLLNVMRPAWFSEIGLRGQVRLRACPTGYDRSLALRGPGTHLTVASERNAPGSRFCGTHAITAFPLDVQMHFDRIHAPQIFESASSTLTSGAIAAGVGLPARAAAPPPFCC